MSKKYIIQIQHLSKQYHQNKVFEDLNLQIKRGVTLVTGKNGASKSTLLKMMIGLEEPTYGEITLFDNIKSNALSKKDKIKIGFQFQNDSFLRGVKVKEYINLYHLMYENSDKLYNSKRIFELLKINELENKYAVNLSGGQKKRLSLFLSVLGERNIIILDEPTAGIDIELKVMILEVIDYLKRCGVTIIVSSHDVEEFIDVCDELVILNKKVLFNGDKHCFYNLYNYKYKARIKNGLEKKYIDTCKLAFLFDSQYIISEEKSTLVQAGVTDIERMSFKDYYAMLMSENGEVNHGN